MTLDEQITFMEELISDDDHWSCENAKSEYRQLLEWLKDYKRLLEMSKGNLISREDLKKTINDIVDQEIKEDRKWAMGLRYSLKLIDNAPTVERPQGEWKNHISDGYIVCSICKSRTTCWSEIESSDYKFCYKCGARMENAE